ncbi:hypothetical protein OK17_18245 [Gordonia sp. GN26]
MVTASSPELEDPAAALKRCPDCGIDKPAYQFNRDRTKRDGRRSYCKLCDAVRSADYYLENRDLVLTKRQLVHWRRQAHIARQRVRATTHKRCLGCADDLPVDDFHLKGSVRKDGTPRRESRCKDCRNTQARNSYRAKAGLSAERTTELSA